MVTYIVYVVGKHQGRCAKPAEQTRRVSHVPGELAVAALSLGHEAELEATADQYRSPCSQAKERQVHGG